MIYSTIHCLKTLDQTNTNRKNIIVMDLTNNHQLSKSKYDTDFFNYVYGDTDDAVLTNAKYESKLQTEKLQQTSVIPTLLPLTSDEQNYTKLHSDEKEAVLKWKQGINPVTNRKIKIWGLTWIKLMETNDWYQWVDPVDPNQKEKYDSKFWTFYDRFENKN